MLGLYVGPLGQRTYLTDITRLIWPLRNVRVADRLGFARRDQPAGSAISRSASQGQNKVRAGKGQGEYTRAGGLTPKSWRLGPAIAGEFYVMLCYVALFP